MCEIWCHHCSATTPHTIERFPLRQRAVIFKYGFLNGERGYEGSGAILTCNDCQLISGGQQFSMQGLTHNG